MYVMNVQFPLSIEEVVINGVVMLTYRPIQTLRNV